MNNFLTGALVPLYFIIAWLFPWEKVQVDSTISVSYIWDVLYFVLIIIILKVKPKVGLSKNILIRGPIVLAMAAACIAITKYAQLNAPFRYIENLAIQLIILAPMIEELVYRHGIYSVFEKLKLKKEFQFIFGSLLFSIGHASALFYLPGEFHSFIYFQLFYTFILGWLCLKARERTNSLIEPILLHFIFNYCFYLAVKNQII